MEKLKERRELAKEKVRDMNRRLEENGVKEFSKYLVEIEEKKKREKLRDLEDSLKDFHRYNSS